jgi:hypothetical protein
MGSDRAAVACEVERGSKKEAVRAMLPNALPLQTARSATGNERGVQGLGHSLGNAHRVDTPPATVGVWTM